MIYEENSQFSIAWILESLERDAEEISHGEDHPFSIFYCESITHIPRVELPCVRRMTAEDYGSEHINVKIMGIWNNKTTNYYS